MVVRSLIGLSLALCVLGCSRDAQSLNADKEAVKTSADRVKEIENNPGMPPAEKERVIAQIKNSKPPR